MPTTIDQGEGRSGVVVPEHDVLVEQARQLFQQVPRATMVAAITPAIFLPILMSRVGPVWPLVWTAAVVLMGAVRFFIWWLWRYRQDSLGPLAWMRLYAGACGFAGIAWSLIYPLIYTTNDIAVITALLMLLFAIVSTSFAVLSIYLPAYLLFAFPQLVTVAVGFFSYGQSLFFWLGIAALIYLALSSAYAYNNYRDGLRAIRLQLGNSALVDELNHEVEVRQRHIDAAVAELKEKNTRLEIEIEQRRRIEEEQQRMQRELVQARKMEALGQLTGGIAHDFNNILAIILGFTGLARDKCAKVADASMDRYLARIQQAGERARDLVSQMLAFSRGEHAEDRPLQLEALARDDVSLLRETLPSTLEIEFEAPDELPAVIMDASRFHQAIMNLAINAREAMKGRGRLTISLKEISRFDGECLCCHSRLRGPWIEFKMADTGQGIAPEDLDHILEPFFTTKDVGEGSGMGLSVVHGIMKQHGGHIAVESMPGSGTEVSLLFAPAVSHVPVTSPRTPGHGAKPGTGQRVMVVDDEAPLAELLGDLVGAWGYRVGVFTNSQEALAALIEDDSYALLITDQTMPGITGVELIARARKTRKHLPAILCSGFSDEVDAASAEQSGIVYLQKPVSPGQLAESILSLLDTLEETPPSAHI